MTQEIQDQSLPREDQVKALNPDYRANRVAVQALSFIEEAIEKQTGNFNFTLFPFSSPNFETEVLHGGLGGILTDIACLDREDLILKRRKVKIRFDMGEVENHGRFLDYLVLRNIREIRCSLTVGRGNPIKVDEKTNVPFLNGVKVSSWK